MAVSLSHIFDVRKPSYREKKELTRLQNKFFTQFDEVLHGGLLEYLYGNCGARKSSANRSKYEIVGTSWRRLGFQQENPRNDLRIGGELQLECLVYFVKNKRTVALQILNNRVRRDDFDKINYPFAVIGIKLASMLGAIFEIYDPVAEKITDCSSFRLQSFWHFIVEKDSFFRIFCATFVLYDTYWTTHFQQEFMKKKYNFTFGMSMDWSLVVWPYHDILMDIFTRCENISMLENFAMSHYMSVYFPEDVSSCGDGSEYQQLTTNPILHSSTDVSDSEATTAHSHCHIQSMPPEKVSLAAVKVDPQAISGENNDIPGDLDTIDSVLGENAPL